MLDAERCNFVQFIVLVPFCYFGLNFRQFCSWLTCYSYASECHVIRSHRNEAHRFLLIFFASYFHSNAISLNDKKDDVIFFAGIQQFYGAHFLWHLSYKVSWFAIFFLSKNLNEIS